MGYNHTIAPEVLRQLVSYDPDSGILSWKKRDISFFPDRRAWAVWNARYADKPITAQCRGYLRIRVLGTALSAHRVAWAVHHGQWPNDQIDHINGSTDDNRLCNLRQVSNAENSRNIKLPANNTSGRIGVSKLRPHNGWRAEICVHGKRKHLGVFPTFDEACRARSEAERALGFSENHGRKGFPSAKERGR